MRWFKSARSAANGACVEVAFESACDTSACVEVAHAGGDVLVRDSKDPEGPTLRFTHEEWYSFTADVKDGRFDLESSG